MTRTFEIRRLDDSMVTLRPGDGRWVVTTSSRRYADSTTYEKPDTVLRLLPHALLEEFAAFVRGLQLEQHRPAPAIWDLVSYWTAGDLDGVSEVADALVARVKIARLARDTLAALDAALLAMAASGAVEEPAPAHGVGVLL